MPATIVKQNPIYAGWNKLLLLDVVTAGGAAIRRSVEDHGRAVAVLPYQAGRRVALLVRQLRVPLLYAFGEQSLLEAPAGILDSTDPQACARREAMEEAGLALRELESVGAVYAMPGVSTERIHLFLAEYTDADRVGRGGGLAAENEEIEIVEMDLAGLWRLAEAGELADLKTLALVQALRLRRQDLFA